MPSLVKNLIDAGIHYGHRTSGWNPKMGPYIYGKKNGIHIIDVRQTIKGLLLAKRFVTRTVADGKDILFVGTKRQARPAIEAVCEECTMPRVTERWLGGTLTNFRTIRSRLKRLEELEALMESEDWDNYSKKMASQLQRERRKIERNLGGIRTLDRLPGALVVIDVRREINALREAHTLGIPTVCLLDTDGDPDLTDIPIPGNDDAMRAIELIMRELAGAVTEGKTARAQQRKAEGGDEEGDKPRRRSSRAQFRAQDDAAGEKPVGDEPPAGESATGESAAGEPATGEPATGGAGESTSATPPAAPSPDAGSASASPPAPGATDAAADPPADQPPPTQAGRTHNVEATG
jgi:small subunit ribosomal protein S2